MNSRQHSADDNYKLWAMIGQMPTSHQIENALLVHGSPRDPVREYMLPRDAQDATKMREVFERMTADFCFVGHSHVPGVYTEAPSPRAARFPDGFRRESGKALVNVGSVGQPRDGDVRASYATFDGETVSSIASSTTSRRRSRRSSRRACCRATSRPACRKVADR